jgi:hypothetical protein
MWHTDAWHCGIEGRTAVLSDRTANSSTYYAAAAPLIGVVSLSIVSLIVTISDADYSSHKSHHEDQCYYRFHSGLTLF